MKSNIEEFMRYKNIFEWYFTHRDTVLIVLILLFGLICLFSMVIVYHNNKTIEYENTFIKSFFHVLLMICVGIGLRATGLELEFSINYMPILLFFLVGIVVIFVQIFECIQFYKNFEEVIKKTNRILIGIIMAEILLLAIMGRLEVVETIAALSCIFAFKEINGLIESWAVFKPSIEKEKENWNLDCPIEAEAQLFVSRKKQVDNFRTELKNINLEPFAVMVSATWGSGKTSFINVLKNTMKQAEFINIEGSFEYDVEGVLNDIEAQLQTIFYNNKIYTGKNSAIGKYFKSVGYLVGNAGYDWAADIVEKIGGNKNTGYIENKEEINSVLNTFYRKTKKRIFIIIDNMDRIIQDEAREKMFLVVSESVGLNNCVTIFVADHNKFYSDHMDHEFIEKYINYHLILCDVSFKEIVGQYFDFFLSENFLCDKSQYIKDNSLKLRQSFFQETGSIVSKIQVQKRKLEESLKKNDCKDSERIKVEQNLKSMANADNRLNQRMKNPRNVRRFLNNIESMLTLADIVWFANPGYTENEYSKSDWVKIIFQVAFLKTFLHEEYDAMILAKEMSVFIEDARKSYVVEYIIEGVGAYALNKTSGTVASLVVYRLYALDIKTNKTQHQKLIEEIDNDELQEENIQQYLDECLGLDFNYTRISKVICFMENHIFENPKYKIENALNLMDFFSSKSYLCKEKGYIEISKKVRELLLNLKKERVFADSDLNLLLHYKSSLQTRFIFQNESNMRILMEILFNVELKQYFEIHINTIEQLKELILKINKEFSLDGFSEQKNAFDTVKEYFKQAKISFKNKEFEYIHSEINHIMGEVDEMLEILSVWFSNTNLLPDIPCLDSGIIMFEDINLESLDTLFEGIEKIKQSAQANLEDVELGDEFIRLVFNVEKKMRSDPEWLRDNGNVVVNLLKETFEFLQELNPTFKQTYGTRWSFNKVRLFKMERLSDEKALRKPSESEIGG